VSSGVLESISLLWQGPGPWVPRSVNAEGYDWNRERPFLSPKIPSFCGGGTTVGLAICW